MQKQRIILVEDDPTVSDIIPILLKRNGYEVTEFVACVPVLQQLKQFPHLFILDFQLVDDDALEVCRHFKNYSNTAEVPLVFLSATPDFEVKACKAGANAFIGKPFTSRHLLNTIRELIETAEMQKFNSSRH